MNAKKVEKLRQTDEHRALNFDGSSIKELNRHNRPANHQETMLTYYG
jgi:hypothetical protein